MGVNSALQDVTILGECPSAADGDRDEEALNGALAAYSARHARDAKALVTMSKSFDGGFATFVLPIILDSIFNKAMPWLFAPNGIRMRDDSRTFSGGGDQRRDRVGGLLATVLACACRALWWAGCSLASLVLPRLLGVTG